MPIMLNNNRKSDSFRIVVEPDRILLYEGQHLCSVSVSNSPCITQESIDSILEVLRSRLTDELPF